MGVTSCLDTEGEQAEFEIVPCSGQRACGDSMCPSAGSDCGTEWLAASLA